MSISSERLAVDASVTNSPHSWCTSQESVVVTTPSVVRLRRSHAIFGAEKYGSSTSPVRAASMSACSASSSHSRLARRSCQTIAGDSGRPVSAVPRQNGLALVGQRDHADGALGLGDCLSAGGQHRVEQRLRVLFDPAVREVLGVQRHLSFGHDAVAGVDHDRLGARGALIDREHAGRLS